jgi:hypothetical protein
MSTPSTRLTRELVRLACLAPSVENTQPWSWRVVAPDRVELYADPRRWLPAADPLGRELVISCGSALDHFEVAAGSFGLTAQVEEYPVGQDPDLLARVTLAPGVLTDAGVERLAALENRRTDRHGAQDRPVLPELVEPLGQAASRGGARVIVLTEPWAVQRTEQLIEAARQNQLSDLAAGIEQDGWIDRSETDGIPGIVAEPSHDLEERRAPTRFERHVRAHDAQTEHAGCARRDLYRPRRPARLALGRPLPERVLARRDQRRPGADPDHAGRRGRPHPHPGPARRPGQSAEPPGPGPRGLAGSRRSAPLRTPYPAASPRRRDQGLTPVGGRG